VKTKLIKVELKLHSRYFYIEKSFSYSKHIDSFTATTRLLKQLYLLLNPRARTTNRINHNILKYAIRSNSMSRDSEALQSEKNLRHECSRFVSQYSCHHLVFREVQVYPEAQVGQVNL